MPLEVIMAEVIDSILDSVKKMIGCEDQDDFDTDLIFHINTVFMLLNQAGVGPSSVYQINGSDETWSDFADNIEDIGMVKTYVFMKVRKIFDPPTSGTAMESLNELIKEFEFRLNIAEDDSWYYE